MNRSDLTAGNGPKVRTLLAAALIAGAALVLPMFGPGSVALAQDCAATDLACVAGTVDDTVNDVPSTIDDTVNTAQDAVAQTVHDVQGLIDGLPVGEEPPGGGGGGGGSGGGPGGGGNHGGTTSDGGGGSNPVSGPSLSAREGGSFSPVPVSVETIDPRSSTGPSDPAPGATARLRDAAARVALPLLIVLAAVLLFTAAQDRLDRREPRLALAPVTGDFVTFK